MAALICSKCGAQFDAPARFCRRCGNSLGIGEPSVSPSEATTKSFEYPVEGNPAGENRTAPANQWPTAPAYLGPDQMTVGPQYPAQYQAQPGAETRGLANKRNAHLVILGIVLFVLLVVVPALAFLMYEVVHRDTPPGYTAPNADSRQAPGVPEHAGIPDHPIIPPPPPGPPAVPEGGNGTVPPMLASLIYPGSRQSVNVHSGQEGTMILSTPDSSSKVMDWYVAKLPNADVVSIPFVGGGVITKGGVSVTITPGSPTTIVLAVDKKGK